MADSIKFQIHGAANLVNRLSRLNSQVQKRGARAATRKAMLIVRADAKREALTIDNPDTTNQIAANIAVYESPRGGRREGGIVMRCGVRGGALSMSRDKPENLSNPGGDTRYWRYLEHGAQTVDRHEFLLPALYNNIGPVSQRLVTELWAEIVKAGG